MALTGAEKTARYRIRHPDRVSASRASDRGRASMRAAMRKLRGRVEGYVICTEFPSPPDDSRCMKCGREAKLCLDHDHKTGQFRGYLCFSCNTGIGQLGDTLEGLEQAVEYLKRAYTNFALRSPPAVKPVLASYHLAWLSAHPNRSAEWLSAMLREGFDVHHIDGDHDNDSPANLALIESQDHTLNIHQLPLTRSVAVNAMRDRRDRIQAACREAGMEYGAFVSKTVKGHKYWYWQDTARKQFYLGPDFPFMRLVVDEYNKAKAEIIERV